MSEPDYAKIDRIATEFMGWRKLDYGGDCWCWVGDDGIQVGFSTWNPWVSDNHARMLLERVTELGKEVEFINGLDAVLPPDKDTRFAPECVWRYVAATAANKADAVIEMLEPEK